jgi:hypothetical protein
MVFYLLFTFLKKIKPKIKKPKFSTKFTTHFLLNSEFFSKKPEKRRKILKFQHILLLNIIGVQYHSIIYYGGSLAIPLWVFRRYDYSMCSSASRRNKNKCPDNQQADVDFTIVPFCKKSIRHTRILERYSSSSV